MNVPHGTGTPVANGLYCAEIYFGWKLLEWRNGEWWFENGFAQWGGDNPKQWVGPMPERISGKKQNMEYDL